MEKDRILRKIQTIQLLKIFFYDKLKVRGLRSFMNKKVLIIRDSYNL